jgi:hypothetical protein
VLVGDCLGWSVIVWVDSWVAGSVGGSASVLAGAVLFLDGPSPWYLSLVQPFSWYVVGVSWASGPATCALERAPDATSAAPLRPHLRI